MAAQKDAGLPATNLAFLIWAAFLLGFFIAFFLLVVFQSVTSRENPSNFEFQCNASVESAALKEQQASLHKRINVPLSILIFSSVEHFDRRYMIRRTWLNVTDEEFFQYWFVVYVGDVLQSTTEHSVALGNSSLGARLLIEYEEFKDLLFVFDKPYDGGKQLLSAFAYLYEHVNSSAVLKVTDQSYVYLDLLRQEMPKKPPFWLGVFRTVSKSRTLQPDPGGWLISQDILHVIGKLRSSSFSDLALKHSLTAEATLADWLAPWAITPQTAPHYFAFRSRSCKQTSWVTYPLSPDQMEKRSELIGKFGKQCPTGDEV